MDESFVDGASLFGLGFEGGGIIIWFDVSGTLFYGTVDHASGLMRGIVFSFRGSNSIWFAEQ